MPFLGGKQVFFSIKSKERKGNKKTKKRQKTKIMRV